jgi:hypothetical protein
LPTRSLISSASRMPSDEDGAGPGGGTVVVVMDTGGAGAALAAGATVVVVMVIGGAPAGAWGSAVADGWAWVLAGVVDAGDGVC